MKSIKSKLRSLPQKWGYYVYITNASNSLAFNQIVMKFVIIKSKLSAISYAEPFLIVWVIKMLSEITKNTLTGSRDPVFIQAIVI